jgi:hypothetical protein
VQAMRRIEHLQPPKKTVQDPYLRSCFNRSCSNDYP